MSPLRIGAVVLLLALVGRTILNLLGIDGTLPVVVLAGLITLIATRLWRSGKYHRAGF